MHISLAFIFVYKAFLEFVPVVFAQDDQGGVGGAAGGQSPADVHALTAGFPGGDVG